MRPSRPVTAAASTPSQSHARRSSTSFPAGSLPCSTIWRRTIWRPLPWPSRTASTSLRVSAPTSMPTYRAIRSSFYLTRALLRHRSRASPGYAPASGWRRLSSSGPRRGDPRARRARRDRAGGDPRGRADGPRHLRLPLLAPRGGRRQGGLLDVGRGRLARALRLQGRVERQDLGLPARVARLLPLPARRLPAPPGG